MIYAYKLFRVRRDGSIGSLFINAKARHAVGRWLVAKTYHKRGFQFRPGWHSMLEPRAPHLSIKGRHWFLVQIKDFTSAVRPESQGGKWYLSKRIRIVRPLTDEEMKTTVNYE